MVELLALPRCLAIGAVIAAAGIACSDASDPVGECMLTFTLEPGTLALVVGDSATVRAPAVGCDPLAARFVVAGPALAPLDTTVAPGRPVVVRAVRAGTDTIRVTVTMRGLAGTGTVPVTVRAPSSVARRCPTNRCS
jgi:hypothetical protein